MEANNNVKVKKRSQWGDVWHRLLKNRMAILGLIIVAGLLLTGLLRPQPPPFFEVPCA